MNIVVYFTQSYSLSKNYSEVDHSLWELLSNMQKENREYLQLIFLVIQFLAEQGLAFREKDKDDGNFRK